MTLTNLAVSVQARLQNRVRAAGRPRAGPRQAIPPTLGTEMGPLVRAFSTRYGPAHIGTTLVLAPLKVRQARRRRADQSLRREPCGFRKR